MSNPKSETGPKRSSETGQTFVITLLRHGESVGNAEARWQGQSDFALTDKGRAQAQALAVRWSGEQIRFDEIITSPLDRARETAEIIGSKLNVRVELEPLWMERNVGEIAGLTPAELRDRFPQPAFINPFETIGSDGEGDWELFLRAGQALYNLLNKQPGNYLVVSHGGILNLTMHAVVGITPHANYSGPRFRFGNTGFARLIYSPQKHRWAIDSLNDHAHWPEATESGL